MEQVKTLLSRIRWSSVLFSLFALLILLLALKLLLSSASVSGSVSVKSSIEPDVVSPAGSAVLTVEIENRDDELKDYVSFVSRSFDSVIYFNRTLSKEFKQDEFSIGPREKRVFRLRVHSSPQSREGRYSLETTVYSNLSEEPAVDSSFLEVE
ncbi:MAG: hypothetical protein GF334_11710 [Candidatus Altiarchaeales archaeon]|nr:hypothetical protein [Candidatus Altiarchaeales archaeon]